MTTAQPVAGSPTRPDTSFPVDRVRLDFPILVGTMNGKPIVYLDNAATSQKPKAVIDAISDHYATCNANIHRGVYRLSEDATAAYEAARSKGQRFLNAAESREIVFVRGTTEAINLVAQTYGRARVSEGDEVIVSAMEHHSNIVPWQMVCEGRGARLRIIPMNDAGELSIEGFTELLGPRTKFVSVVHVSNSLGTINPAGEIVRLAHERGVPVLVDGAQAAPHLDIDVQALGCDFYTVSGHKMFGPTGIGLLYGRAELLEAMPPYQGGWGHDPLGNLRADHLRSAACKVRGGNTQHSGRDRLGSRHRLFGAARFPSRRCSRAGSPGLRQPETRKCSGRPTGGDGGEQSQRHLVCA